MIIELLENLKFIKYTSVHSINRINDKKSSSIARESQQKFSQINNLLFRRLKTLIIISLSTAEHYFSFSQLNFAITMIQSSVETQLKNYDSSNSQAESSRNLVIYSKFSKQIFKFFKTDFV